MEDSKIIELFFERSEQAIAELSYKYGGVCRKIAFNILNNLQDVEECVNDTYLGAWNSIPPQNPNPLVTYICKITRNIALKKYRYNTAKRRNGFYDISLSELEECIPSVPQDISSCTEEELTKTIEKFLDTLDRKSRVMFIKRYWYAESVKAIAGELGYGREFCIGKTVAYQREIKEAFRKGGNRSVNRAYKLSNAIGNIDDKFILEAFRYRPQRVIRRSVRVAGIAVASLFLIIGMATFLHKNSSISVTVYAYETNKEITNGEAILMSGQIDNNGQMRGHPLQFYVLGDDIKSIRFSCRNEWISFVDWTEQRGDYGLSKNFTVTYGEKEADYYYLVMDWVPQNIIRKLTDNENVKISDMSQEEKEDVIVMEITYLNGRTETAAIWICLDDNGEFKVSVSEYQITEEDKFIFQPDSQPINHQP